jgi:3-hydroxybutyrate dehydrogenase
MKYLPLKCSWTGWSAFGQLSVRIACKTNANLWRRVIAVNLDGTFYCSQSALPDKVGLSRGRSENIERTAGLRDHAYVSAYCAAKPCVIVLTRSLSRELATNDITVNAVCPGYSDTEMARQAIANIAAKASRTEHEAFAELTCHNAQEKLIKPSEVANSVAWLYLPGSEAITGQLLSVSGGEVS